jgi:mRNA-degrading endonuclease RelE of RelBE toxin-antitoxin system
MIEVLQSNGFRRAYKRLNPNQKAAVDKAVNTIVEDPTLGEAKKGDLAGRQVALETTGAVERMQGYKGFCKVRFGAYRVGLRADRTGSVEVMVVAHSREIYRLFP